MNMSRGEKDFHDKVYKDGQIKDTTIAQFFRAPFYKVLSESIGEYELLVTSTSQKCSCVLELGGGRCTY